eukprot:sb/3468199/
MEEARLLPSPLTEAKKRCYGNMDKTFLVYIEDGMMKKAAERKPLDVWITEIYTDGSKIDDVTVGCAWARYHRGQTPTTERLKLSGGSTVYQAEMLAIKMGAGREVELWEGQHMGSAHRPDEVYLFSDSQAALSKLASPFLTTDLEIGTAMTLNRLSELCGAPVQIHWVRGHQGCPGNELADREARLGAISTDQPLQVPLPVAYLKQQAKARERRELSQALQDLPKSVNKLRHLAESLPLLPSSLSNTSLYRISSILNNRFPLRFVLSC